MTLSELLFSFRGRIGRKAYWFAFAIFVAVQLVAALVDAALVGHADGAVSGIVGLAVLVSGIAVSIKRWHDRDKSGWWVLIALVPIIGGIWALVENGFLRGTIGANRFGPDPVVD